MVDPVIWIRPCLSASSGGTPVTTQDSYAHAGSLQTLQTLAGAFVVR